MTVQASYNLEQHHEKCCVLHKFLIFVVYWIRTAQLPYIHDVYHSSTDDYNSIVQDSHHPV